MFSSLRSPAQKGCGEGRPWECLDLVDCFLFFISGFPSGVAVASFGSCLYHFGCFLMVELEGGLIRGSTRECTQVPTGMRIINCSHHSAPIVLNAGSLVITLVIAGMPTDVPRWRLSRGMYIGFLKKTPQHGRQARHMVIFARVRVQQITIPFVSTVCKHYACRMNSVCL